jgi:hypothetical protein
MSLSTPRKPATYRLEPEGTDMPFSWYNWLRSPPVSPEPAVTAQTKTGNFHRKFKREPPLARCGFYEGRLEKYKIRKTKSASYASKLLAEEARVLRENADERAKKTQERLRNVWTG